MNDEHQYRKVTDMYFAAALLSYQIPLEQVDRSDPKKQVFVFDVTQNLLPEQIYIVEVDGKLHSYHNPTIDVIETRYISQQLLFPPSYPSSLRRIKSTIHSAV